MSFVLLGILNSQAAGAIETYWLASLNGGGRDEGNSVIIDSSGNAYALGRTSSAGAGDDDFLLAKYDSEGTVAWQRVLGGAGEEIGYGVALDSIGNIYASGYTTSSGAGNKDFLLAKYNSSGTVQFQRTLGGSGDEERGLVAVDSSDNIYICGFTDTTGSGGDDFLIAKYNSSGTVVWQRTLGGGSFDQAEDIFIDSSDNILVAGRTNSTGQGNNDFLIAKYNSSGTIQWQRTLGVTSSGTAFDSAYGIATDSSDNVYVAGMAQIGSNTFIITKYNSSGTLQWQRSLAGGSVEYARSVRVDSSDNVYVLGQTNSTGAGNTDFLLAKYDSSGTIQWQRTLGGPNDDTGFSVSIDSSDNLYVLGYKDDDGFGVRDFLLGKLPNDGSLTGTYDLGGDINIVYQASTLTAATSSLTSATSSLTSASASLTSQTPSLTSASASLTEKFVQIG